MLTSFNIDTTLAKLDNGVDFYKSIDPEFHLKKSKNSKKSEKRGENILTYSSPHMKSIFKSINYTTLFSPNNKSANFMSEQIFTILIKNLTKAMAVYYQNGEENIKEILEGNSIAMVMMTVAKDAMELNKEL
jgi:hypothetical protein